ncbi:zf-HC2 domain-containing protein [Bacillus sp. RO3]|nr:zf-HC2 domain-containing protein [Bacillus sp. RO3]
MKFSCEVVQHLHPLYEAGDLSLSVKGEVEDHIKGCEECRSIYKLSKGEEYDTSNSSRRSTHSSVKILLGVISVFLLIILLNFYQSQRNQVFSAYDHIYKSAEDLEQIIEATPDASREELRYLKDNYFQGMYEGVERLTLSLNWFEKQRLKSSSIYVNQQSFYTALENLHARKSDGRWDEIDQKMYDRLSGYAGEYRKEVEEDYKKFNHGYSSYFQTVDVRDLSMPIEEINKHTYTYNRFHQLPDQVKPMDDLELKKRIADFLKVDHQHVKVDKNEDDRYRFTIKRHDIEGEVDPFSGYPVRMDDAGSPTLKGELLDVNEIQEKASSFLQRMYGEDKSFAIEYLGINVNDSSNVNDQYYTFGYMPMFGSMRAYAFSDQSNRIYVDARSGEFRMMNSLEEVPIHHGFRGEGIENITAEEGSELLKDKVENEDKKLVEKRKYKWFDSFFIYSSTSGGFVPVHAYGLSDQDSTWRYINMENGKEEHLYVKD